MTYKVGIIYRIEYNENPEIRYIGSTFNSLTYRWRDHKANYNKWKDGKCSSCSIFEYFEKYGFQKFTINKIKEYEVVDKIHLLAYEQLWINKMNCVNKNNPHNIRRLYKKDYVLKNLEKTKEYQKDYRLKNVEKTKEYHKEYNIKNATEIKQKMRDYRLRNIEKFKEYKEKNKERINNKQREKVKCVVCNLEMNKSSLRRHKKKQHQ
jgi:hypothetical protein